MQLHGLGPARLLCPWDSPGKNTGVGCLFLLQGNFLEPGIKLGSPTLQADFLPSEPPGKLILKSLKAFQAYISYTIFKVTDF